MLIGGAGDAVSIMQWKRWVMGERNGDIEFTDDNSFHGLLIDQDAQVWLFANCLDPMMIEQKYAAIGNGQEAALAAMMMGASAMKAIKVTSEIVIGTGSEVDFLPFYEGQAHLSPLDYSQLQQQ